MSKSFLGQDARVAGLRHVVAVMPALDAIGPSITNTRLSITCARGANVRSM